MSLTASGAARGEPHTAVAGRPRRALANREVEPLCQYPRLHSEADIDKIAASIGKLGRDEPGPGRLSAPPRGMARIKLAGTV